MKEQLASVIKNDERWRALLDANPVHFANSIDWAKNITVVPPQDIDTIPIVNIGGLWGTICADGIETIDDNAYMFFCSLAGPGYVPILPPAAKSHDHTENEYGKYPVLLNLVQCEEDAGSFNECSSGPMGIEYCASKSDLQAFCGPPEITLGI